MKPLSIRQAANLLGVSLSTMYQHARNGRLDPALGAIRCGRTTRFPACKMAAALGVTEAELAEMIAGEGAE